MSEIYADWKSLKPLTAPVPVGTKCVVVKLVEGDKLAIGEIVTTIDFQRVPNCKNSDGIVDFFGIDRLAILPADYNAEAVAEPEVVVEAGPAKLERKIIAMASVVVHGHYEIHAVCNDGTMWVNDLNYPSWTRSNIPPIPQD